MKIICQYSPGNGGTCNSEVCRHRVVHEEGTLDESGTCRWADNPRCVPWDPREMLIDILSAHLSRDGTEEVAAKILVIFGEAA